jgi:phosphatidylglycerophosphatase A
MVMSTTGTNSQVGTAAHTNWAWIIATFFGIGRLAPGPGTWASIATVVLWRLLALGISGHLQLIAFLVAAAVTALGIPASTRVARESGIKDPGFVVIDEVAGQMLPLIIAPLRWKYLLLSLILFRCFDILKPPPVRALERLPEGIGIVLDDLGAGIYSLLVLAAVMKFWPAL